MLSVINSIFNFLLYIPSKIVQEIDFVSEAKLTRKVQLRAFYYRSDKSWEEIKDQLDQDHQLQIDIKKLAHFFAKDENGKNYNHGQFTEQVSVIKNWMKRIITN